MYQKQIKLKKDKTLGYIYFMDKEHPLSSSIGKVYYHRHVYSLKIGRWLRDDEVVHHIDGDKTNNNPENLLVTTNSNHSKHHNPKSLKPIFCESCGKFFTPESAKRRFCSFECSAVNRRLFDVTKEELSELVWKMPTLKVAKLFGVSDAAISKRCKKFGIIKPGRGYWTKKS